MLPRRSTSRPDSVPARCAHSLVTPVARAESKGHSTSKRAWWTSTVQQRWSLLPTRAGSRNVPRESSVSGRPRGQAACAKPRTIRPRGVADVAAERTPRSTAGRDVVRWWLDLVLRTAGARRPIVRLSLELRGGRSRSGKAMITVWAIEDVPAHDAARLRSLAAVPNRVRSRIGRQALRVLRRPMGFRCGVAVALVFLVLALQRRSRPLLTRPDPGSG